MKQRSVPSNKDIKEEASLSRLFQHTKNKDTFAVIGSQDKDTKKSRFQELKSLVSKLRNKIANIGYNYLEGTYTYENGEQGIEDSLIIYNIPKDEALDIANELNQESIIWKDNNYFGFIEADGTESGTFDKGDLTFDQQVTNMYGSRLRSGNNLKPAFAFECKLVETDNIGNNFCKQHSSNIKKYPVCSIKLVEANKNTKFSILAKLLKDRPLDEFDSVAITDYIISNDLVTFRQDLSKKQIEDGYEAIYNVYENSELVGYLSFKEGKWIAEEIEK